MRKKSQEARKRKQDSWEKAKDTFTKTEDDARKNSIWEKYSRFKPLINSNINFANEDLRLLSEEKKAQQKYDASRGKKGGVYIGNEGIILADNNRKKNEYRKEALARGESEKDIEKHFKKNSEKYRGRYAKPSSIWDKLTSTKGRLDSSVGRTSGKQLNEDGDYVLFDQFDYNDQTADDKKQSDKYRGNTDSYSKLRTFNLRFGSRGSDTHPKVRNVIYLNDNDYPEETYLPR